MQAGENTITIQSQSNWLEKAARSSLMALLSRLPKGQLVLKEHGVLIDKFGKDTQGPHAEVDVLDAAFYIKILSGGSVAAGETYVDGLWNSPDLTEVIRLFAANITLLDQLEGKLGWLLTPLTLLNRLRTVNSKAGAKKNIAAHYDLGNALYRHFLDDSMMYSAAIYPQADSSLAEAQQHKLKVICDKLALKPGEHLLEIGTGWGGLALFAARHYGCEVTTTTISEQQYAYTQALIKNMGLEDRVHLLKRDYRELTGQYDKLVSIEMVEAVGKNYLANFFQRCSQLLKADGLMLLQSITISEARLKSYSKGQDFIQRHIFPGGFLPSPSLISRHIARDTDMEIRDCEDIGLHYAHTLRDWHQALLANKEALATYGYDERFMRLWSFYFCYCEGGFLQRTISTVQLLLSKPQYYGQICRG